MKLEKDATISHYRILSLIGKGGMGEVYLAQDTELKRNVAIKFLSAEFLDDTDKLHRFIQEAQAASALNHPNILTIYEIGEADGTRYIVTEFIDGKDLTHHISENKISLEFVLDISIQMASALKTAHDAGIVHRDVKPDNVMIRSDGLVKILDFGLAKLVEKPSDETPNLEAATIAKIDTVPGIIMGTPNYMSPEQARGKDINYQTDIFSLGVVIYEMLTRRLPFPGDTISDIIASILTREPRPIGDKQVPADLKEILEKCLEKEKRERYLNTSELLEDLKLLKQRIRLEELERTILPEQKETKIFQATTAGQRDKTAGNDPRVSFSVQKSKLNKLFIAAAGVLLVAAIGVGYLFFRAPSSGQINSIAVMPFINEGGNQEIEYLSDGMTETLIGSLSQIPELSIKARTTVFRYKGKKFEPKQVGAELNVAAILIGSIVKRGESLVLNLELVESATENVLWSQRYDRRMTGLASFQSEIAGDVASRLKLKLTGEDEKKVTRAYTAEPKAFQAYLKGRYHWAKRGEANIAKGIEFFKEAVEVDPDYALAWGGLADSYLLLPEYGGTAIEDVLPKARLAAAKAVELGPDLAETRTSFAAILFAYDWDFARGEREYRKAIELNPNYVTAHYWYSEALLYLGRFNESRAELDRAQILDPMSPIVNFGIGYLLYCEGNYESAVSQYKKVLDYSPDLSLAHQYLGLALAFSNKPDEALKHFDKATELSPEERKSYRAQVLAISGEKAEAKKILADLESSGKAPSQIYAAYALAGDKDNAFKSLEDAYRKRHFSIPWIKTMPSLKSLHDDERWKDLIKRIGFPS